MPLFQHHVHTPVALSLGDRTVSLLRLSSSGAVVSFARAPLPEGIIRDGIILDRKRLVYQITELCAQAIPNPIVLSKLIPVVLAIPETRAYTHVFSLPKSIENNRVLFEKTLEEEAGRIIPTDLGRMYWDFRIIPTHDDKTLSVLFSGAPKDVVQEYIAAAEEAHFAPIAIDLEMAALGRSLMHGKNGSMVIMDIGAKMTSIGFFDEGKRLLMSVGIPIAGESFTDALVKNLNISREEAEFTKQRDGFNRNIPNNRTLIILQERVQAILRDFHKGLSYFELHFGKKVGQIILTGGSALIPDLNEYLKINLAREVEVGNALSALSSKAGNALTTGGHPITLGSVVGLALRAISRDPASGDMNLLKGWEGERWAKRERLFLSNSRRFVIPVFCASLLLLGYVAYFYFYAPYQRLKDAAASRVSIVEQDEILDLSSTTTPSVTDSHNEGVFVAPDQLEFIESVPEEESEEDVATSTSASSVPTSTESIASPPQRIMVKIAETPTGWLNVRSGPGTQFSLLRQVFPGEQYPLLSQEGTWVQIILSEEVTGWVSQEYVIITQP